MTLYTRLVINSVDYTDFSSLDLTNSTSEYGISSNFSVSLLNINDIYNTTFSVGQTIEIYVDDSSPATTKVFSGIIENVDFGHKFKSNNERITLTGRDLTSRLQDVTIEPEVYTNQEVSVIIKDIISKYVEGITTTNVDTTTTTIQRIAFNHVNVYEGIKRLAEESGYMFYVDVNFDLNFKKKEAISSGDTLNNTNTLSARAKSTREGVVNKVWVYGDRTLVNAPVETFNVGSPLGGSVFTLNNRPHNTSVSYLGSVQTGGIYNNLSQEGSGTNYLVDFFDQQIVFISGTNIGDSIPTSGGSITVDYQKDIPIVKFGLNRDSINLYGPISKVIVDNDIKDPTTAADRLKTELSLSNNPPTRITVTLKTTTRYIVGNTVIVDLPSYGISSSEFTILNVKYKLTPETSFGSSAITLTLNKKIQDITDKIGNLIKDVNALKGGDIQDTDIITRLEQFTGSIGVRQSGLLVKTRTITGSVMIWNSPAFGIWETDKWGTTGSAFGPYSVVHSGGYF